MSLSLRIRHPQGVSSITVDPSSSIESLLVAISAVSGLEASSQDLKSGYPPKPLVYSTPAQLISSLSLSRNEQIVVSASTSSSSSSTSALKEPPVRSGSGRVEGLFGSSTAGAAGGPGVVVSSSTSSSTSTPSAASAPPSRPSSAAASGSKNAEGDWVQIEAGYLVLKVVPDDNSCLFSAIGAVFAGGIEQAQEMRKIVARAIERDPETYSEMFLERPPKDYVRTILTDKSWGGAIELSIFSEHFKTEISSIDVATGRIDRFGEGQYSERCILIYSGIHYDLLLLSPTPTLTPSNLPFCETVFPTSSAVVLAAASELATKLKARHYYTDTAKFDLRCGTCGVGLKGEKGAREHARGTGHVDFGEY
ncbi:hypothetical protein BDY24DRAFT_380620 [Mrakia frigida]|uniref:ubiquitin-specific protease OTU1 n=1 Tax=Mrakia frigida TaxID=29902 RepID=UPI003FCC01FE